MRRYFVVANQTLIGDHLAVKIREAMEAGPSTFHVIVPATPASKTLFWTEGEAVAAAEARLKEGLEWLRGLGAEVDGEVGDGDPLMAIEDALRERECDELILSTLPPGRTSPSHGSSCR
jgi:hypothetical protein